MSFNMAEKNSISDIDILEPLTNAEVREDIFRSKVDDLLERPEKLPRELLAQYGGLPTDSLGRAELPQDISNLLQVFKHSSPGEERSVLFDKLKEMYNDEGYGRNYKETLPSPFAKQFTRLVPPASPEKLQEKPWLQGLGRNI
jgi:hypothetical protein